jgi:CO/xanthine dehydrogenase FAD-binding subunit
MFYRPESIDEALALKSRLGAHGTFLAGGTDLVVGIRKEKTRVEHFIDLTRIAGLDGVYRYGDRLRIGALCTHAALEREAITALADACETVGGPQIRNRGTIGGQLGTASPAGDVSVALIALDADCEIASMRGTRTIALADLFVGPGRTVLSPDEMLLSVSIAADRKSAFYKIGKRDAVAISLVMAAASVAPDGAVSIGLGCVAPVPLRARLAEAHVREHGLSDDAIERAAELAMSEASPISDHRGSAEYRRAMCATLVRRLLRGLR